MQRLGASLCRSTASKATTELATAAQFSPGKRDPPSSHPAICPSTIIIIVPVSAFTQQMAALKAQSDGFYRVE